MLPKLVPCSSLKFPTLGCLRLGYNLPTDVHGFWHSTCCSQKQRYMKTAHPWQVRRRRELEMLQREQLSSQGETVKDESAVKIWPFWRKKEFKLRALTRRIVELSNRKQLGKVSVNVVLNLTETFNPNP